MNKRTGMERLPAAPLLLLVVCPATLQLVLSVLDALLNSSCSSAVLLLPLRASFLRLFQ